MQSSAFDKIHAKQSEQTRTNNNDYSASALETFLTFICISEIHEDGMEKFLIEGKSKIKKINLLIYSF